MLATQLGYLWWYHGWGARSWIQWSGKWVAQWEDQTQPLAASYVGFFLGGDVPGKPVYSGAGVYRLHPKQMELVLLWILSKPQDCSKALDWLGYSLVDMPQTAWQSHNMHLTVSNTTIIWLKSFLLSFLSWLCFSLCGFAPGVHLACCGFPVWEK